MNITPERMTVTGTSVEDVRARAWKAHDPAKWRLTVEEAGDAPAKTVESAAARGLRVFYLTRERVA